MISRLYIVALIWKFLLTMKDSLSFIHQLCTICTIVLVPTLEIDDIYLVLVEMDLSSFVHPLARLNDVTEEIRQKGKYHTRVVM